MRLTEFMHIRNFLHYFDQTIEENSQDVLELRADYYISIINKATNEFIQDRLKIVTDIFEEEEKYIMFYDAVSKINIPLKRIKNVLLYSINENKFKDLNWNTLLINAYFITNKEELSKFITSFFDYRHFIIDESVVKQLFLETMNKDKINDDYIELLDNKNNLIDMFSNRILTTHLYLPFAVQITQPLRENLEDYQLVVNLDYELFYSDSFSEDELHSLYNLITQNIKSKIIEYAYKNQILDYFDYFTINHTCYMHYSDFERVVSISMKFSFNFFKELLYIWYCKNSLDLI